MKPATCRTCGKLHWGRVCASSLKSPAQDVAENVVIPAKRRPKSKAPQPILAASDVIGSKTALQSEKFDRVAYQREYMRKRRALQKEAKGE